MNTYALGNLVRCSVAFVNSAGSAVDPTAVYCKVTTPAGVTTTYTYGVDAALVRLSTGSYYIDVSAGTVGIWRYRFYSTGTGQAADETGFVVEPSEFD